MYLALKNALGKSFVLFSGLLNKFSGATAAYSFRNLNNAYAGPIVEVRRGIDTNTGTNEKDFSIGDFNQVADWVNGLQETTLPANVASSAAAYSLRKVNSSYSSNVVRIRRASDNVEVNVGFDSDDKVSTSSPITNVPEEFLSNDFNTWQTASSANVTSSSSFTTSADAQGVQLSVPTGTKVKVTGAGTVTGAIVQLYDWSTGGNKQNLSGSFSFSTTFTIAGSQQKIYFRSAGATSINFTSLTVEVVNDDGGDTTATTLGEFLTEGGNQDATVHTWYDQSGNAKNATQDTSGSQPKIASTGSLLDDIDFSGDSFLQASSLQEQVPVSIFSVNRFDSTLSGFRPFIGNGILDSNSEGYGLLYNDPNNTFRSQVRIPSASTNLDNTASTSGNVKALTTAIINASTITSFYNGGNETSASNTQGAVTPNRTLTIGGSETGSSPSVTRFFNGGISEIILYSTDESTNRFRIESNINNYYGLSNVGLTGNWTADGNEEAFTADGQDGFTCQVATASVYVGQQLSEKLPSGGFINLSFDLDLQPLGGTAASINLILKKTTNWSSSSNTVSTATIVPVQGRNSVTLTSNDADAEYVVFAEGSDNVDFKVSNFKVSKFPFNDGFVHTWYDQSGNSNHATQDTGDSQPKIVNAGSLTNQKGKPCLDFDGVDDVMEFSQADVNTGNIRSVFVACSAPTSQKKSVMGTEGEYVIKRDSSRAISLSNFGASRLDSAFTFSGTRNHLVTVIRNFTASTSSLSLDGDVDDTRTDSYGLNSVHQIGGKKSGSNIIEEADFNCLEIIVYASDQTTNRTAIESNIDDYYDII